MTKRVLTFLSEARNSLLRAGSSPSYKHGCTTPRRGWGFCGGGGIFVLSKIWIKTGENRYFSFYLCKCVGKGTSLSRSAAFTLFLGLVYHHHHL